MKNQTIESCVRAGFLAIFGLLLSVSLQAQTAGSTSTTFGFSTIAFGGQLGQRDAGSFGSFGANDQWIGIGQPTTSAFGPSLDAYGMRVQWAGELATFSLNGDGTFSGNRNLEIQWGGGSDNCNFNHVFNPLGGAAGKTLIMSLTSEENVGIRVADPDFNLHLNHDRFTGVGNNGGLKIANEFDGDNWVFYTSQSSNDLRLFFNNAARGAFNDVDGVYTPVSDRRLKKDIQDISTISDKIMQLRPTTYLFNEQEEGSPRNYGLIAQELKEVFPEMVTIQGADEGADTKIPDLHMVNYNALIPVLIKGMQEQNERIAEQQEQIEALQAQLEAKSSSKGASFGIEPGSNQLFQNEPNPFNAFTTIRYQLNPGTERAAIYIFDLNGRQLRTFENLSSGEGEVSISGNELEPGMYLYSLVINGEEIATKRMILTR